MKGYIDDATASILACMKRKRLPPAQPGLTLRYGLLEPIQRLQPAEKEPQEEKVEAKSVEILSYQSQDGVQAVQAHSSYKGQALPFCPENPA